MKCLCLHMNLMAWEQHDVLEAGVACWMNLSLMSQYQCSACFGFTVFVVFLDLIFVVNQEVNLA